MGIEVRYKNSFPGYYSMRNINQDYDSSSWHIFYGDNAVKNNHYYEGFTATTITDEYPGQDKDKLKHKMLRHEAIFKNQVYELHRLYRRQRDMMEEVKRKEYRFPISIDMSSSSTIMPPQKRYEDAHKWQIPSFPLHNPTSSCSKRNGPKDCEVVECRPSKVRKKLFDLQLPAHEYIGPEEGEQIVDKETCFLPKNEGKPFLDNGGMKYGYKDTASIQRFMGCNGLTDLNEPVYIREESVDFFGQSFKPAAVNLLPKIQDHSRMNQTALLFGPSRGYPFVNVSDMGKRNDSLTRKLTAVQTKQPFLSSPWSHEGFGDKWHRNGCYGMNNGSGGDVPARNGFYHGSSSGSKEPSARLPSVDGSQKIFKGSNFVDLTDATKGMDLNTVQTLSDEDDDSRICDRTMLSWLKNGNVPKEKDDSLGNNKKLLGIPIFGNFCSLKNDMEHRGIDINVAWAENIYKQIDVETCNERREETKSLKNQFDLNSCVTEDDDLLVTESVKSSKKITMEIDLEAPAVSEIEEEEAKPHPSKSEETVKLAAEAIVTISHHQDFVGPTSHDPLLWFVEVISSREKNMSARWQNDEYEMLTLQQKESKEEDYMPTPLVCDFQEPDEVGPLRRGQARRGRPRRDFQRDILPGMSSLSRHEISEDVQIFGGLMRATGHSWNLGSTRRKGNKVGGRGRRKVKETGPPPPTPPPPPSEQPENMEVVGLDERSLTGWGKTTRRPRRQRCGAVKLT